MKARNDMQEKATVFIVDDDQAIRDSLSRLMDSIGLATETFADAQAFLDNYDNEKPGCLLLDIRMPGMGGMELQQELSARNISIPIIIISAHGSVEQAVQAMKTGAVDFIRKPYDGGVLLDRVKHALELDADLRQKDAQRAEVASRINLLTPRETEVMKLLAAGKYPKEIAFELGLSRKTVDVHRSHIMMKMQADSAIELAQMLQTQE